MMGGASSRRGLWLDPRTKILLLLFCILSAMMAPSLFYELGLVVLIGLLGVCFGKWKYAWKGVLFYALIVLLTLWIMDTMTGTWRTMFIAFLGLFHKVYPCGMLSGIVLSTTKVSEFLSAMNRIHAPKKLVIPLAVMLLALVGKRHMLQFNHPNTPFQYSPTARYAAKQTPARRSAGPM